MMLSLDTLHEREVTRRHPFRPATWVYLLKPQVVVLLQLLQFIRHLSSAAHGTTSHLSSSQQLCCAKITHNIARPDWRLSSATGMTIGCWIQQERYKLVHEVCYVDSGNGTAAIQPERGLVHICSTWGLKEPACWCQETGLLSPDLRYSA